MTWWEITLSCIYGVGAAILIMLAVEAWYEISREYQKKYGDTLGGTLAVSLTWIRIIFWPIWLGGIYMKNLYKDIKKLGKGDK